jgi:hypothetical protein
VNTHRCAVDPLITAIKRSRLTSVFLAKIGFDPFAPPSSIEGEGEVGRVLAEVGGASRSAANVAARGVELVLYQPLSRYRKTQIVRLSYAQCRSAWRCRLRHIVSPGSQ